MESTIVRSHETDKDDVTRTGGKGSALGELIRAGAKVPKFFVVSAQTFTRFISTATVDGKLLIEHIRDSLKGLDVSDHNALKKVSEHIKELFERAQLPSDVEEAIKQEYTNTFGDLPVSTRSSATAEDMADNSFAGQQSTFLNIQGADEVVLHVKRCMASLYNTQAISYRTGLFDHMKVSLATVVQQMIQPYGAGVIFTVNPNTGNPDHIVITFGLGLGEAIVSGAAKGDTYIYSRSEDRIISREIGIQTRQMLIRTPDAEIDESLQDEHTIGKTSFWQAVPEEQSTALKLDDKDDHRLLELARSADHLHDYFGKPVDIEYVWADGNYTLQTRPMTVIPTKWMLGEIKDIDNEEAPLFGKGTPAGPGVAYGQVMRLNGPEDCANFVEGRILVTNETSPEFEPAMKIAAAILTVEGTPSCHAAIVSREKGLTCLVAADCVKDLQDGDYITVDAERGLIFKGKAEQHLTWYEGYLKQQRELAQRMANVETKTKVYCILSEPELAEEVAALNPDGVGLLRLEELIRRNEVHPMRYLDKKFPQFDPEDYINALAAGISRFCAAFGNRPVVLRTLDFKTNEMEKKLEGADDYETTENNPMLGLRGIARYMFQPEVFALELEAIKRVRKQHKNLIVMLPFVRTLEELQWAKNFMADYGLERGVDGFELWIMAEVASNILEIEELLEDGIDGVSIGSNDLNQNVYAIDRDNPRLLGVANETSRAMKKAMSIIIDSCVQFGVKIGICGQGPSTHPELATWLVSKRVTSISVMPDVIPRTRLLVSDAERELNIAS